MFHGFPKRGEGRSRTDAIWSFTENQSFHKHTLIKNTCQNDDDCSSMGSRILFKYSFRIPFVTPLIDSGSPNTFGWAILRLWCAELWIPNQPNRTAQTLFPRGIYSAIDIGSAAVYNIQIIIKIRWTRAHMYHDRLTSGSVYLFRFVSNVKVGTAPSSM